MSPSNAGEVVSCSAAEIARPADWPEPAKKLLDPSLSAGEYLQRLIENGLWTESIRFVAMALPARYGIWWGCLCLAEATDVAMLPGDDKLAFEAAVRWVANPIEAHRQATEAPAERAGLESPAGGLARAVFFHDYRLPGSRFRPAESVTPAMLTGVIQGARLLRGFYNRELLTRKFLELALLVSRNERPFPPSAS